MSRLATLLRDSRVRAVIAVVVALLSGVTVTVIIDTDSDGAPDHTVTIPAPAPVGPTAPPPSEASGAAESVLERAEQNDLGDHAGARTEPFEVTAPPGPSVPEQTTLASPQQDGCRTSLVRNYSSRGGVSPRLFVLHYTVSPNRPGRSDVDGITAYFNGPGSQASSHYVIDNEGHCNLIVPESMKAWTQGAFNPVSISSEQINTGSEASYAGTAGLAKLAQVVSDSTARWNIPLRVGKTVGCTVVKAGVVDHDSLGCGNNHTDIKPYSTAQVVRAALAYRRRGSSPLTSVEQRIVRGLERPRGTGHSRRYWCQRATGRVRKLDWLRKRSGTWKPHKRGARRQVLVRARKQRC